MVFSSRYSTLYTVSNYFIINLGLQEKYKGNFNNIVVNWGTDSNGDILHIQFRYHL